MRKARAHWVPVSFLMSWKVGQASRLSRRVGQDRQDARPPLLLRPISVPAQVIGLAFLILLPTLGQAQSAGPVVGFQKLRLPPGQHDLDSRLSAFALDAGTISSVANERLLSAGCRWETNRWTNHQVLITTGSGAGLLYTVGGNSESQLSVEPDPLAAGVVLVGARFEILPNVEDDFGTQLAAGDRVGVANGAAHGEWSVWKDADGQWRDSDGHPATLPLLPGQRHRVAPGLRRAEVASATQAGEEREVVITGRVLWPSENEREH